MLKKTNLLAGLIIAVSVVLAVLSVWGDSLIVDEIPHVGAGYSYLTTGDYRLNPEHPPLAKDLGTFPLLFLHLKQTAFQTRPWTADLNGQWEFGRNLIYETGNDAQLITHAVEMPMLLFFVLAAVLMFRWARKLYGDRGGFIALILFCFSPTIMAHARFVTTDVAALFGVLTASYFFLQYLRDPTRKHFWFAALVFGLALLTKFSTILLVPFFLILAFVYNLINFKKLLFAIRYSLFAIFLMLVGFVLVVWPVYYLHTMNYPVARQHQDTVALLQSSSSRYVAEPIIWASDKPVLRAAAQYGLGLLMATQRSVGGNTTYFLGEVSRFGWHYYFPIVYFIKEPLPFWGLVVIALLMLAWSRFRRNFDLVAKSRILDSENQNRDSLITYFLKNHFEEFAMLLWLGIYWATSIHSNLNIGVRHLLPIFPFTILLVSGQISRILISNWQSVICKKKLLASYYLLIAVLLGWYVFENLRVFPYYLTYFNQVAGGPAGGYRYVADSNLDWGQDLVRFSNWVKANHIAHIELDYFGWADPYYYLGDGFQRLDSSKYHDAADFLARNQSDGWLAISATFLQGSEGPPDQPNKGNYLWLNSFQPTTVIGHSIFVWHLTK